jgi:hypothetical protein
MYRAKLLSFQRSTRKPAQFTLPTRNEKGSLWNNVAIFWRSLDKMACRC